MTRHCAQCGRQTQNAQPWQVSESIPYKQQGWVGDQFIPYDQKFKAVRDRRIYLCGICYATKQCEESREGGTPMTDLEKYLANLAEKETAPTVVKQRDFVNIARVGVRAKFGGYPSYHLSNLSGNLKRQRDRLGKLETP